MIDSSDPDLKEGLDQVFDAHFAEIHRYIARRLDTDTADDLAADTFLIAFRDRHRFDAARGAVRPWLYGIATNLVARHRREEVRRWKALSRTGAPPGVGAGGARGRGDGEGRRGAGDGQARRSGQAGP
ncbi:RNA polymerase sigma factor [Streptosporangium saharense]|uniref:RNA polymerase sigma factor n=1 Tax=Streptosporangium saharense TaxID=1706840 RepID=UPI003412BAA0